MSLCFLFCMPFKFLDDVSIADIAFEATGKNLDELFESAANATIESLANPKSVKSNLIKKFHKTAKDLQRLLFDLLEEIVFLKDAESMVFHSVNVSVVEKKCELTATLIGDYINPKTQELRNDVKAVTMHYYTVEKTKTGWIARVVLDI